MPSTHLHAPMQRHAAFPNPAALAGPLLALTLLYWKWRHVVGMLWQIRRSLLNALLQGSMVSGLLIVAAVLFAVWIRRR
jgi:hypothetical protein